MTDRILVDTDVLVYARDASEQDKQQRAAAWMGELWRSGAGRLSVQVLQEFYVTVSEKLRPGLDRDDVRAATFCRSSLGRPCRWIRG